MCFFSVAYGIAWAMMMNLDMLPIFTFIVAASE